MRKQLCKGGFRTVLSLLVMCVLVGVFLEYSQTASSQQTKAGGARPEAVDKPETIPVLRRTLPFTAPDFRPTWSQAASFHETPALKDLRPVKLSEEQREEIEQEKDAHEKHEANTRP